MLRDGFMQAAPFISSVRRSATQRGARAAVDFRTRAIVLRAQSDITGNDHGPSLAAPASRRRYLGTVVVHETPVQQRLRAETAKLAEGGMQIGADQGVFLAFLARADRRAHGRSRSARSPATARSSVASALPPDGRLVCCDVSEEWTSIARRYWAEAGARRPDRAAPAARAGDARASSAQRDGAGTFDFAFIDADKTGYDAYYEACLELFRAGGLIAIDNVLWSGTVADPADRTPGHGRAAHAQREDPRRSARRRVPREPRRRRDARARSFEQRFSVRMNWSR